MKIRALTITPSLVLLLFACGCASIDRAPKCEGYSDWQTSPYILPYRVGTSCFVVQGNCSPRHGDWTSHRGPGRYSYDFLMPIGTPVIAVRDGQVSLLEEGFTDDDHGLDEGNYVVIMHDDETVAVYGHLTHDGVLVDINNRVKQGDTIALSGASGASEKPHLHLHVAHRSDPDSTLPITYRNTRPNPRGLQRGEVYQALKYGVVEEVREAGLSKVTK
ncbi:MAG: peptidoglycan DD-metalloendopeptidase family protein [Planctomycetota bacterium]|jgi:murein DD-endopeptidase MepM/ murein hydrolase activator NlpD